MQGLAVAYSPAACASEFLLILFIFSVRELSRSLNSSGDSTFLKPTIKIPSKFMLLN